MAAAKAKVKICGLTDPAHAEDAADLGANFVGVVFYHKSPRFVTFDRAAEILEFIPAKVARVGLFVDADDGLLTQAMNQTRLDYLQLHGSESAERVEQVRFEFGMPVIKAVAISSQAEIEAARVYDGVADMLMFDAKPPAGADRPGGNGLSFDWSLLKDTRWQSPWFLAGGLTPKTVEQAIAASGAKMVDVSSGVENAPGVKDYDKMAAFIAAAKGRE
jgi:phosphoribosylanthranilate isomerase